MTKNPNRQAAQKGNRNVKRGRAWEDLVAAWAVRVANCSLTKTTAPFRILRTKAGAFGKVTFEGVFERRGQCDFVGQFRGIHVELEAKRIQAAESSWRFRESIKPHQWDILADLDAAGGLAGVLLMADDGCSMFGIRWRALQSQAEIGRTSISVEDLRALAADSYLSGVFDLREGGLAPLLRELYERRKVIP